MEVTEHRSSAIAPSIDQNVLDSLQFNEEIHHLITLPVPPENANSFTALLELPPPQAVGLLHHHTPYHFNSGSNLTFPCNSAIIERATKFSIFAGGHNNYNNINSNSSSSTKNNNNNDDSNNNYSPETTGSVSSNASGNLGEVKNEPAGSDSNNDNPNSSQPSDVKTENRNQRTAKRKEREKKKGKAGTKKSKSGANDGSSVDAQVLPCVHVRARRGQATDSHSLAERARREKINARMKLLQELVPGCHQISGKASVLDEIINHVQLLQHQVEFLSMRLAAVNPSIDFNLDSILATEGGSLINSNYPGLIMPAMWSEVQASGNRPQYQQQWHTFDGHQQPVWGSEEESLLSYDSSANSASLLHSNQLKMEL